MPCPDFDVSIVNRSNNRSAAVSVAYRSGGMYKFTISEKSQNLKTQYMEDDNSIKAFFESEGYIEFNPDEKCSTLILYKVYSQWYYDNAIKPSATAINISAIMRQNLILKRTRM